MSSRFGKGDSVILLGGIALLCLLLWAPTALAKKGSDGKGWLGVYIQDLDQDLVQALDLKTGEGVLVNEVAEESPAEEAGIKAKDVILKYQGKSIKDSGDLTKKVRETKPGEKVKIEINRDGSQKKLSVVIGESPRTYQYLYSRDWDFYPGYETFYFSRDRGYLGVSLRGLTEQLGDYFGVKNGEGALITEVAEDSPAEKVGLKAGDVIVKVDGDTVEDPGDVNHALRDRKEGDKVEIEVLRDRKAKTFTVEVEERGPVYGFRKGLERSLKVLDVPKYRIRPDIRIEIDKDKLEREMEKLKEELKELKEELERLKEKGI